MSRKRQRDEDASITKKEENVFVYYEHTSLDSIPENGVTSLRIDKSVKKIPDNAFEEPYVHSTKKTRVEFEQEGSCLKVIGDEAFMTNETLQELQFPSTLVEIGWYAFWGCSDLKSVGDLPASLTIIRDRAFGNCFSLERFDITNDSLRLEEGVFEHCSSLTHFRLPRGMTTIPDSLFKGCRSLTNVDIPPSVMVIQSHAFAECEELAKIELPPSGLKTIGDGAFEKTGLKNFHCPASVESIGEGALSDCEHLESVILPPKLARIPDSMLSGCTKLTDNISIPKSVVQIGECAFAKCRLTRLDLSLLLNLTTIGEAAFSGCSHLKSILLPMNGHLQRIERMCFNGCSSLTHLWVPPSVEYIDNGAFDGCKALLSVEVPETLKHFLFASWDSAADNNSDDEEEEEENFVAVGYESLVNLYLPPSHQLIEEYNFDFMENMKLGQAESDYPELVAKLKCRFDSLPLHRTCYFQSYHSLRENIKRIQSIVPSDKDDPSEACERTDFLGMTPFHILALSQRPWLNLFQTLLSVSSSSANVILNGRDVFGCTPLDYLCKNTESTAAVSVIKSLLLQILESRISFLGLAGWRHEIFAELDKKILQISSTPPSTEDHILFFARHLGIAAASSIEDTTILALPANVAIVCQKLQTLERMEVLSLLEMAVWKMQLHKTTNESGDAADDDRETCRIHCGSRIILEHVIPLLAD